MTAPMVQRRALLRLGRQLTVPNIVIAMLMWVGLACTGASSDRSGRAASTGSASRAAPRDLGRPLEDQTPPRGTNGIAFDGDGRLWIADLAGGQILAVDPADGSILVRLGATSGVRAPDDLVFDADGRLWWTENVEGTVGRIDHPLGAAASSVTVARLGPGVNPIAIGDGGDVLVARTLAGDVLYRLDPVDPTEPIVVKDRPGQLNAFAIGDDGRLYAPRFVDGEGIVSAIDPGTGKTTDLARGLPLTVSVKIAGDGTLRVLTVGPATVWRLDVRTGERERLAELPSGVADNQALDRGRALWVSAFDQPLVWRLDGEGEDSPVPVVIGQPAG